MLHSTEFPGNLANRVNRDSGGARNRRGGQDIPNVMLTGHAKVTNVAKLGVDSVAHSKCGSLPIRSDVDDPRRREPADLGAPSLRQCGCLGIVRAEHGDIARSSWTHQI